MHSFFDNLHEDNLAVRPSPGSRIVVSSVEGHEKEARINIKVVVQVQMMEANFDSTIFCLSKAHLMALQGYNSKQ